MGISNSSKKSTTNSTTNTATSNQSQESGGGLNYNTSTSTPNIFAPAIPTLNNYYGTIGDWGNQIAANPYSFTASQNSLQTQAGVNAGNLGGWQSGLSTGNNLALAAANPAAVPTATTQAVGYTPGQLGGPAGYSATGYSAPSMAALQQAVAQGYTPTQAEATALAQAAQATATHGTAAGLLDNGLEQYLNPYRNEVVNTTLANFDDAAGRATAAQAAQAAKNKAFGGSRYAIQEAQTQADLARTRAGTEAGLRNDAFNAATALANTDAQRRQDVSLFNANLDTNTSQFNAGQTNARNLADAQLQQQLKLANAGFANDAAAFGANAANQASIANAGYANSRSQAEAALQADAARYNADAMNQAGLFNANNANNFALTRYGAQNDAARYGADALNNANLFNANAANNMGQFNANLGQDAAFRAAGLLSDNASRAGSLAQGDVASQLAAGNSLFDTQSQVARAPLEALNAYGGLLNPSLLSLLSGETNSQNGGTSFFSEGFNNGTSNEVKTGTGTESSDGGIFGKISGAAKAAAAVASLFSDRRLKTNINRVGALPDGLGVYEYDYVWGGPRQRGVMADEVAQLRPWALGPKIEGYATVDYSKLEAA